MKPLSNANDIRRYVKKEEDINTLQRLILASVFIVMNWKKEVIIMQQ